MVNCVSALAAAQHIEVPINTNNNFRITKGGFVVKIKFLRRDSNFRPIGGIAHRFGCWWIFSRGGINGL